MFNSAQNCYINLSILDELPSKLILEWLSSSNKEVKSAIIKCNDLSTPGPDYIFLETTKDVLLILLTLSMCVSI